MWTLLKFGFYLLAAGPLASYKTSLSLGISNCKMRINIIPTT